MTYFQDRIKTLNFVDAINWEVKKRNKDGSINYSLSIFTDKKTIYLTDQSTTDERWTDHYSDLTIESIKRIYGK